MQPRLVFKIKAVNIAVVWYFFNEDAGGPETQLRYLDLFYGSPEKPFIPNQNNLPRNDSDRAHKKGKSQISNFSRAVNPETDTCSFIQ